MPASKIHLYPDDFNSLAKILQAVGHGARLSILSHLQTHGGNNNKELVNHLGLSQSTVSGHLKTLREAGLIVASEYDTSILYSLSPEGEQIFQSVLQII